MTTRFPINTAGSAIRHAAKRAFTPDTRPWTWEPVNTNIPLSELEDYMVIARVYNALGEDVAVMAGEMFHDPD